MVASRASAVISTETESSRPANRPVSAPNNAAPIEAVSNTDPTAAISEGIRQPHTSRCSSVPVAATAAASSQ